MISQNLAELIFAGIACFALLAVAGLFATLTWAIISVNRDYKQIKKNIQELDNEIRSKM
jgi:cell division protein FtsL